MARSAPRLENNLMSICQDAPFELDEEQAEGAPPDEEEPQESSAPPTGTPTPTPPRPLPRLEWYMRVRTPLRGCCDARPVMTCDTPVPDHVTP